MGYVPASAAILYRSTYSVVSLVSESFTRAFYDSRIETLDV